MCICAVYAQSVPSTDRDTAQEQWANSYIEELMEIDISRKIFTVILSQPWEPEPEPLSRITHWLEEPGLARKAVREEREAEAGNMAVSRNRPTSHLVALC